MFQWFLGLLSSHPSVELYTSSGDFDTRKASLAEYSVIDLSHGP